MPSAMTTVFGSAIPCRRAARFGVSPTMPRSCASPDPIRSPTTTSPVAMPTRVCSGAGVLSVGHRRDQLQPRPHRPLGVILMGLRIAEINQHAVAHVFRHEAAEAAHGLGDAFLIGRNDLAQVLRVHAGRERRRADQVREHHRDLAALGGVLGLRLGRGGRLQAVSEQRRQARAIARSIFRRCPSENAEVLEVLIGQIAEDRDIDVVLGKALRVLGHAERFEPVRNLLHRGPVACASGSPAGTVYPSRREFEGRFLAGPMFLPSLLAIADEVIQ